MLNPIPQNWNIEGLPGRKVRGRCEEGVEEVDDAAVAERDVLKCKGGLKGGWEGWGSNGRTP